jgi:hypothetical protein
MSNIRKLLEIDEAKKSSDKKNYSVTITITGGEDNEDDLGGVDITIDTAKTPASHVKGEIASALGKVTGIKEVTSFN